ncbi:hypothetical protein C3F00_039485, partial [Pseudomonas sp. MWU13-2860]
MQQHGIFCAAASLLGQIVNAAERERGRFASQSSAPALGCEAFAYSPCLALARETWNRLLNP